MAYDPYASVASILAQFDIRLTAAEAGGTPTPAPTLVALSLSPATAIIGTSYNGTISGNTAGSSLALGGAGAAGLNVSGSSVTGTPTTAGAINIVETLAGATNSPRTSTGVATVSAAAVTLSALTLSPSTATVGTAYSGTVSGKTSGSTLSLTGAGAAGLNVSGTTVSGTPTAAGAVNLVETLAGATNSPRTSSGVLTVSAASATVITPANWDYGAYGDSRTENAFPTAVYTNAGGYGANSGNTGPAAFIQQETGNRLRPCLYPNFGISATTSLQGAANPRISVHGDTAASSIARNQTVPSEFWRGGTSRAAVGSQETNCGPFNKNVEAFAASGAGIMVLLDNTNDQNADLASNSRDAILSILNRAGSGVLKIVLNETSKGIRVDGTSGGQVMQPNLPAFADWVKTLSFDSGSPNARNDVIVVDTFTPTYDAANQRNVQGYLRDGLHFTPWGSREIAKLIHTRLTAVYGSTYTNLPRKILLPVSNGASIAADTVGAVHGDFIHTNPLMTFTGTNGTAQGTNWATGPNLANIPQGWVVSGTGAGTGITVQADRSVDPDGYPQVTLTIGGTLADSSTYTLGLYQLAQQAGQLALDSKLRSFARVNISSGSQQLQGFRLRSYLFSSTTYLAQQSIDMNNSAGGGADRLGYLMNSNGYDAGGSDSVMCTQLIDLQNPNMTTANGGFGTATAVGNFSQVAVYAEAAFSNYTGSSQAVSAVIKISRCGMTKVSG